MRKTNSGYEVVSVIDDKELVNQSIVTAYKRTSEQMPYSIRLLTEIIRSQTLPVKIASIAKKITEDSVFKVKDTKEKMKKLRRLMYVAKTGEFILSENRSDCSVVTTVKPVTSIFKKKEKNDLALAVKDRTYIEENLIHTDDFNFYTTDSKRYVGELDNEAASYKMKLENTETKQYRFIRFYHLSTYKFTPSKTQAIVKSDANFKPAYKVVLDRKWLEKMYVLFLSFWINGFGLQMTRDKNKVLSVALGKNSITFKFVYEDNKFTEKEAISFENKTVNYNPLNIILLSRDIVPVLNSLFTMEITSNITLTADQNMLQFAFKTECGEYSIAVPCVNENGKRINTYMEAYGD